MSPFLTDAANAWAALYSDSAGLRTGLGFAHVAGLVVSGGSAIAADRAVMRAKPLEAIERLERVAALHSTHRLVVVGLVIVIASGLLLFAADVETYVASWVFWLKMGCVALLLANGALVMAGGRAVQRQRAYGWALLRGATLASLSLWFLTTLLGAALPNV